jgi:hypothetical protein
MENIFIKSVKNGFVVEVSPYGDDDLVYIYKTKEELLEALPKHVEEAISLSEKARAEKEAKNPQQPNPNQE